MLGYSHSDQRISLRLLRVAIAGTARAAALLLVAIAGLSNGTISFFAPPLAAFLLFSLAFSTFFSAFTIFLALTSIGNCLGSFERLVHLQLCMYGSNGSSINETKKLRKIEFQN